MDFNCCLAVFHLANMSFFLLNIEKKKKKRRKLVFFKNWFTPKMSTFFTYIVIWNSFSRQKYILPFFKHTFIQFKIYILDSSSAIIWKSFLKKNKKEKNTSVFRCILIVAWQFVTCPTLVFFSWISKQNYKRRNIFFPKLLSCKNVKVSWLIEFSHTKKAILLVLRN